MAITFDKSTCCDDGLCVQVCPRRNFFVYKDGQVRMVASESLACNACGHCVAVCPTGSLNLSGMAEQRSLEVPQFDLEQLKSLMLTRRSIRAYTEQKVERALVEQLLNVARYAPTGGNLQRVEWLAVDSPAKIKAIIEETIVFLRTDAAYAGTVAAYDKGVDIVLRGAPCLLLAHAPEEYALSPQDCTAANTYLELLAHANGLGSCWPGFVIRAAAYSTQLRELLGIPQGRSLYAGLMLGYPAVRYHKVPQRKALRLTWM